MRALRAPHRELSLARLDRRLALLALAPERFDHRLRRFVAAVDALGLRLEISDPAGWRGAPSSRVTVDSQFRSEVRCMRVLDQDEEKRLVHRIEFAARRFEAACRRHGHDGSVPLDDATAHTELLERRREWHALRLEMVERNLFLVLVYVRRFRRSRVDPSDLIQTAGAALFRAVDGFDWRRGVQFRTYAAYWLARGFLNHMYDAQRVVRVPCYLQKSIKHIDAAIGRLGDPHATVEDIARASGLSGATVLSAQRACRSTWSLDVPFSDSDSTTTLGALLPAASAGGAESDSSEAAAVAVGVQAAMGVLTPRERVAVAMRFGIGFPRSHIYSEIAEELGVSLERVRQILLRALAKMRTPVLRRALAPLIV
ncbi:MAG: sigma-70 family RNA polymerase sigma factor [Planctomycetes bacterium]|nr:sigma-70 family RNA polymerase sigma factor [Planctomycetota bacterium]